MANWFGKLTLPISYLEPKGPYWRIYFHGFTASNIQLEKIMKRHANQQETQQWCCTANLKSHRQIMCGNGIMGYEIVLFDVLNYCISASSDLAVHFAACCIMISDTMNHDRQPEGHLAREKKNATLT